MPFKPSSGRGDRPAHRAADAAKPGLTNRREAASDRIEMRRASKRQLALKQLRGGREMLDAVAGGKYPGGEAFLRDLSLALIHDAEEQLHRGGKSMVTTLGLTPRPPASGGPRSQRKSANPPRERMLRRPSTNDAEEAAMPVVVQPHRLYTTEEAAHVLRVSRKTLEARRGSGIGGPVFTRAEGTRAIRYQGADLLDYIQGSRRTSTTT